MTQKFTTKAADPVSTELFFWQSLFNTNVSGSDVDIVSKNRKSDNLKMFLGCKKKWMTSAKNPDRVFSGHQHGNNDGMPSSFLYLHGQKLFKKNDTEVFHLTIVKLVIQRVALVGK